MMFQSRGCVQIFSNFELEVRSCLLEEGEPSKGAWGFSELLIKVWRGKDVYVYSDNRHPNVSGSISDTHGYESSWKKR
jgi:hypothetical protein